MRSRAMILTLAACLTVGCGVGFEPAGSTPGATTGGGSAAANAASAATTSAGGFGAGGVGGIDCGSPLPPSIATCISTSVPDPAACEEASGAGHMSADLNDNELNNHVVHIFLRFDDVRTMPEMQAVELSLVVADNQDANSGSSGEVWATEPFDAAALAQEVPAGIGDQPVGNALSNVSQGDTVTWNLPRATIHNDGNLYLSLRPLSDDGVTYWAKNGMSPPSLVVCMP